MSSPLALALPAMTAVQAVVSMGCFSLPVPAPQMGLGVTDLALLNTLLFSTGAVTALLAGRLLASLGDWKLATLCAAAVAAGMGCLAVGGAWAPWCAVLPLGLAFGPETPVSAAVLGRITLAHRRPWFFSVRQTSNQIGAACGALALPALWAVHERLAFAFVAGLAIAMALWCAWLRRDVRLAPPAPAHTALAHKVGIERAALQRLFSTSSPRLLALAALVYTAVQMCLNTY